MKKILSMVLAVLLVLLAGAAALAEDELPQPEGGKKFEGVWALAGGKIEIIYEEEGYRVAVDLLNNENGSGEYWEYSCYYREGTDDLASISTVRSTYTIDPETQERIDGEAEYLGVDGEEKETVFAISENGALVWKNGYEPTAAEDLEFRYIGWFEGTWRSAEGEEPVWVEFTWKGMNEETYYYEVYLHRGDEETYKEYLMTGLYNEETGKLECTGNGVLENSGETLEAVFSRTEDGKLLYEAANGIVLEYDLLGGSVG